MCGIFGIVANHKSNLNYKKANAILDKFFILSELRGKESSGIAVKNYGSKEVNILKQSIPGSVLIKDAHYKSFLVNAFQSLFNEKQIHSFSLIAHTRLVTNGSQENNDNNQPVLRDGFVGVHNGILCNINQLWENSSELNRLYQVDSEWLVSAVQHGVSNGEDTLKVADNIYKHVEGTFSTAVLSNNTNYLLLSSNNGSMYFLTNNDASIFLFSSERMILEDLVSQLSLESEFAIANIEWSRIDRVHLIDELNLVHHPLVFSKDSAFVQPLRNDTFKVIDQSPVNKYKFIEINKSDFNYYTKFFENNLEEISKLKRCSKCLLPETFPFINYDEKGVCSYCHSYRKNEFKGVAAMELELAKHRKKGKPDTLVTLSGGRDSCYGIHYMKKEMGMNPIAYTYDWGMVTDLARRNQARMCGKLGIEHILISADIKKKRENIRKNVEAWLKNPHLGTIPLFMAGDKQYFYYANMLQKRYNLDLVILCENMLETTNFKYGFCGIEPHFDGEHTFSISHWDKMRMIGFYGKQYLMNPAYLNKSLVDTMGAFITYYFLPKNYLNLFDYKVWDEKEIENVLYDEYDWEISPDTTTTWRIGDGTAAFYNYIYYNVAGFSEFDTFRSNQIREGMIDREKALELVNLENRSRMESFKWYCDTIGLDMEFAIKTINAIPKLYRKN
jgi:glucosamine--fructose-6-phosphate aminotransferase (isomerizing)